jgi:hypothetical protein
MLGVAMYTTIKTLWNIHKNKTLIAEMTGHDWKTVDKIIKQIESGQEFPKKKAHASKLDPYKKEIMGWMEDGYTGDQIKQELQLLGLDSGRSTVSDYISKIKKRENIFIRVHTKAGEEAQVDFGYIGLTLDNSDIIF